MPLAGGFRAVIFDMDGLLLDTETLWSNAEAELFRRHGAVFTHEDQMRVIGTSFEVTARYFAELVEAGALPAWLGDERFHRSHQAALLRKDPGHYGPLFPDVDPDQPYHWPVEPRGVPQ